VLGSLGEEGGLKGKMQRTGGGYPFIDLRYEWSIFLGR